MNLVGQPERTTPWRERLDGLWDPTAVNGCGAEIERIRKELFGAAHPVDDDDRNFQWAIAGEALRYAHRVWKSP